MPEVETTEQNYDEIFTDDKLDIKSNVVDFAHLIEQDTYKEGNNSKVYSISAEFGIGKTFFCNKLQQVLLADGVRVGKLNIWEMDFYENPLVPILAELNNLYAEKGKKLPSKIVEKIGKISSRTLSALCELAVKKTLGADTVDVCKEKFLPETIYDDYNEYQKALHDLKKTLSNWSAKQENKPIVIIIDELDRCKPDYAVKTLEVLKHFFDVPGFVFILALDEEQLKKSVQTLFGATNYEGYKRKFINNSFMLPEPNRLAFTEYLYEKSGIDQYIEKIQSEKRELVFTVSIYDTFLCARSFYQFGNEAQKTSAQQFNLTQTSRSIITRYFAAYCESCAFSLRKMEQVFDRLVLFTKQINTSKELYSPDLATFLICQHAVDAECFNQIRHTENLKSSVIKLVTSCDFTNKINHNKEIFPKHIKQIDRSIVPEVLSLEEYSCLIYVERDQEMLQKVIYDNVDRFFVSNPEKWLYDTSAISTKGVLTTDCKFDVNKFKENYCKHIEFISHFE